jgi:nicotinamidase-related amidase
MDKTALIIVDVQNCFITEENKDLPKKISKRIPNYHEVIFTRFVNHDGSNFAAHGYHKCKNEHESSIHQDLAEIAKERKVFTKHTFSAFKAKGIIEYLKEKGIDEVHICGTDTDACVMASAYEAFDLGFRVRPIYELCASCNGREFHEAGKKILERNLVFSDK